VRFENLRERDNGGRIHLSSKAKNLHPTTRKINELTAAANGKIGAAEELSVAKTSGSQEIPTPILPIADTNH
jgi:hypothetical protein